MPARDNDDSYWECISYGMPLQTLNNKYGYSFTKSSNLEAMKELLHAIQRGLRYETCSRPELLKFVKNKLNEDCEDGIPNSYLICKLHFSDGKQTFRYLDLPPELRERIAKYYIREFSNVTLTSPTQPPLARTSRLVRREVLPLFYRFCRFRLTFDEHTSLKKEEFLRINNSSLIWMKSMEPESFACIRNLELQISCPRTDYPHINVTFDIEVSLKSDGTYVHTASWVQYAQWQDKEACKNGLTKLMNEIGARDGPNRLRVDDIYRMRVILESKRSG